MSYDFKIFKLHFSSPLHLGDERADYSISLKMMHSDAFYGALFASLSKIKYDLPSDGDLNFTISSLFPFYQKNEESEAVLFFPKLLGHPLPHVIHQKYSKEIKKVQWVDTGYFERMISGDNLFDKDLDLNHIKGNFLTSAQIEENFINSQVTARVQVPRDPTQDAIPYYMDRLTFSGSSGLYFVAQGNTTVLEKALEVLKDEGLGTDRTIGNGLFTYCSRSKIHLSLPQSEYATNLSLFCPQDEKQLQQFMLSNRVAWDFKRRGGWITSGSFTTYRKNSVYMFTEGSVFKTGRSGELVVLGKIVDLKPEIEFENMHSIWRNGKALFVPVIPFEYE